MTVNLDALGVDSWSFGVDSDVWLARNARGEFCLSVLIGYVDRTGMLERVFSLVSEAQARRVLEVSGEDVDGLLSSPDGFSSSDDSLFWESSWFWSLVNLLDWNLECPADFLQGVPVLIPGNA